MKFPKSVVTALGILGIACTPAPDPVRAIADTPVAVEQFSGDLLRAARRVKLLDIQFEGAAVTARCGPDLLTVKVSVGEDGGTRSALDERGRLASWVVESAARERRKLVEEHASALAELTPFEREDALAEPSAERVLARLARRLHSRCAFELAEEERTREKIAERLTELGLPHEGSLEEIRQRLCIELAAQLPPRGKSREILGGVHEALYGCSKPGPSQIGPTGLWNVRIEKDPITDVQQVFLRVQSGDQEVEGDESLIVRCDHKRRVEMFVNAGAYLGYRDYADGRNIEVRLDSEPPSRWWVTPATSSDAFFISGAREKASRDLPGKKVLVVRYPTATSVRTVSFPIAGFEEAVKPLAAACGFTISASVH